MPGNTFARSIAHSALSEPANAAASDPGPDAGTPSSPVKSFRRKPPTPDEDGVSSASGRVAPARTRGARARTLSLDAEGATRRDASACAE